METPERLAPENSAAFVQGGSRGVGLAFVKTLLERESFPTVFASTRSEPSTSLQRLGQQYPDKLKLLKINLRQESSIAKAAADVRKAGYRLDMLINVAGLLHDTDLGVAPEKKLEQCEPESLARVFEINAFGPILMTKHFAPLLCHGKRAILASLSARVGSIEDNRLGGWYAYRASKAAQNMFTKTSSIELARRSKQIICVALHPGTVDTDLSKPFQRSVPEHKLFSTQKAAEQLLDVIDSLTPNDTGKFYAWDGSPIPW